MLGVSASAPSHALKGLETQLGVRRINRSVALTAAGAEFCASLDRPSRAIGQAIAAPTGPPVEATAVAGRPAA